MGLPRNLFDFLLGCTVLVVMMMIGMSGSLREMHDLMESTHMNMNSAAPVTTSLHRVANIEPGYEKADAAEVVQGDDDDDDIDDDVEGEAVDDVKEVEKVAPTVVATSEKRPVIDLLSVGSLVRPDYQDAQEQTMGYHKAVRDFYRVNELNDTEVNCHSNLTTSTVGQFVDFCDAQTEFPTMVKFKEIFAKGCNKKWLTQKSNPGGWLCAQKRPLDGVYGVLSKYKARFSSYSDGVLPDYFIIMDDDTYVNLDTVPAYAMVEYPIDVPHVVAGCLMRRDIAQQNFTSPFGGYSSILSKAAVYNFIRPIYCDQSDQSAVNQDTLKQQGWDHAQNDGFVQRACWRLERNEIGEKKYFQQGMSVAELMHAYSAGQKYTDPQNWHQPGFCMHSDVALAYFINFYNIPIHSGDPTFLTVEEDRYRGFNGSILYYGKKQPGQEIHTSRDECKHGSDEDCPLEANFCHHITAKFMLEFHQRVRSAWPESFRPVTASQ